MGNPSDHDHPVIAMGIDANERLIVKMADPAWNHAGLTAIEKFVSHGQRLGDDSVDTIRFSGRLEQVALHTQARPAILITRAEVKKALRLTRKARDTHVRRALIRLYADTEKEAIGSVLRPGPLYGMKAHIWAAFGVAVACDVMAKPRDDKRETE